MCCLLTLDMERMSPVFLFLITETFKRVFQRACMNQLKKMIIYLKLLFIIVLIYAESCVGMAVIPDSNKLIYRTVGGRLRQGF